MTANIHPTAFVGPNVEIGDRTIIGPNAVIDGPGPITIGPDCRIDAGACIGQAGFGYERDDRGEWQQKSHEQGVVVEANVHIGANACIDCGSWRPTLIKTGVRIDNLVHIAHNVIVGERTLVIAQAELSGSVEVGADCWIAPHAAVHQRLKIGDGSTIGLGAVVLKDVPPGSTVAGVPAREL